MASAGVLYWFLHYVFKKVPSLSVNCKAQRRAGGERSVKPKPHGKDCLI